MEQTNPGPLDSPAEIRVLESIAEVDPEAWNRLAGAQPFLRHAFLLALEQAGCVSPRAGWIPRFITLWDNDGLTGALPLYVKHHSYGEYVFDWAWADAYQRHGLRYYPKLLSAIPFTPVPGSRLLAKAPENRVLLISAALALAKELGVSSFHCLFPCKEQMEALAAQGLMIRSGLQFHWQNRGYRDFDDYLAAMSHDKRKKIKQERRKVAEADISLRVLEGMEIQTAHWEFFNHCYQNTYRQHHSTPYLNLDFFFRIGAAMPENIVLVLAERGGVPIASALNFRDDRNLYGRYWGAVEYHPGLHFETCYYRAIQYSIETGLETFEGGAQGEHKLARGFLPVETWSAHWLAHPEFSRAVENFLEREAQGMHQYIDELRDNSPFKNPVS